MKIHLPWIRVTATAVLVAGVGVHEAAAQYAPYRPIPQQPAAPAQAAPVPVVAAQPAAQPAQQPLYTAYRTPAATPAVGYVSTQSTPSYGSPTGAQYTQPTSAYPQYPQTAAQYPQTPSQQYPVTYGANPYVAMQPGSSAMPAPSKPMVPPAAQPSASGVLPTPAANNMPAYGTNTSAAQPGGCGCNAANYGAGSYYTSPGCGCAATGGYPNCGVNNYFSDNCGCENQWFGGIYFLEMGRTNATPVKLTSQMPPATAYPYYPQPNDTILTNRDVNFDFREGLELRVGSTFTIGDSCSACQSGCGCNSCAPQTTYAWEVAWWGINNSPDDSTVMFNGTDRIYGMKSYVGLQYDRDGAGGLYANRPVNDYYDYKMPITDPAGATPPAGAAGYVRVVAQRVRTDFKAQDLELNFIRFPVCNTGCSTGCSTNSCGCGGYDACGCNSNCGGCDSCGGFAMYGSCGVRYFRVDDDFMYGSESEVYDGAQYGPSSWLDNNIDVKNSLVGPQIGWTNDYCWGKWNVFLNSTFGIFDNHSSVWQRVRDENGNWATFQDGSNMNVRSSKDSVAFLGELRTGVAYDFSCHWRGVVGYRAVAITGLATAAEQLQNNYTDRWTVGLIDSDNGVIIHGAQVGAECRY